ncbi:MAG TPA: hypothetical protein PLG24_02305, partial [Saprospiraceae bacterium]|nr:hypothetical protein [Saprospiraceae bacterium]
QGHKDFQSFALPTELRYQSGCKYRTYFQFDNIFDKKIFFQCLHSILKVIIVADPFLKEDPLRP